MNHLLISETLGASGNRIARQLNATRCTLVADTDTHTAYMLHGSRDFRWIETSWGGVGEDADGFEKLWEKVLNVAPHTIAEIIASEFGDDGQIWTNPDGETLKAVCQRKAPYEEEVTEKELTRYVFNDGSAIVMGVDGWDVEGRTPFIWQGAE